MPPLPEPNRRRRNAPTIPTTKLPATGRAGPAPRLPKTADLGLAGKAWWKWAWSTPQAAAWDAGAVQVVLRRARLEDALAAVEAVELGEPPTEEGEVAVWLLAVQALVQTLKGLAAGALAVQREMRELDDRLGLSPKAMAQLRWTIVDDATTDVEAAGDDQLVARLADRRRRLADAS